MADRCPDCDRPLATTADSFDPVLNPDDSDGSDALCWRRWNQGDACDGQPMNWRARALAAEAEVTRLTGRRDELPQTVARISQTTPFPDEIEGWESQRAALVAEVGTLRARVSELDAEARMLTKVCDRLEDDLAIWDEVRQEQWEAIWQRDAALASLDAEHTVLVDQLLEVAMRLEIFDGMRRAYQRNATRFAADAVLQREGVIARDQALDACQKRIAELLDACADLAARLKAAADLHPSPRAEALLDIHDRLRALAGQALTDGVSKERA